MSNKYLGDFHKQNCVPEPTSILVTASDPLVTLGKKKKEVIFIPPAMFPFLYIYIYSMFNSTWRVLKKY